MSTTDNVGFLPAVKGAITIDSQEETIKTGKLGQKKVSFSPDSVAINTSMLKGFLPAVSPTKQFQSLDEAPRTRNVKTLVVPSAEYLTEKREVSPEKLITEKKTCFRERKFGGKLESIDRQKLDPQVQLKAKASLVPIQGEFEPVEVCPTTRRPNRTRISQLGLKTALTDAVEVSQSTKSREAVILQAEEADEPFPFLEKDVTRSAVEEEVYEDDFEAEEEVPAPISPRAQVTEFLDSLLASSNDSNEPAIKAQKVAVDLGVMQVPVEQAKDDEDYDRWFLPDSPRLSPPTPEPVKDQPYTIAELRAMLPPSRYPQVIPGAVQQVDDTGEITDEEFEQYFM